jgi:hypothetical protein
VQLADFLAGIVRRTQTAALDGDGDPVLLDLVRPYLAGGQNPPQRPDTSRNASRGQ